MILQVSAGMLVNVGLERLLSRELHGEASGHLEGDLFPAATHADSPCYKKILPLEPV